MTQIDDNKQLETIDITKLLSLLPHRYPFLLIDRVININSDLSATGIKNVTFNEPYFIGHFPENPIMPGVLIIEAMAQTAGAISLLKLNVGKPGVVYFITIDKAKFRKPVKPGDQLKLHVKKIKERSGISRFDCVAEVDGVKVAEAEIAAMIAEDTGNE